MLTVVIAAVSIEKMRKQIQSAQGAGGLELRLDYLTKLDLEQVAKFRQEISLPVIFTLRRKEDGGKYAYSEKQRLELIQKLAILKPDFFDLEHDLPISLIQYVSGFCQVIGSYHNFSKTPDLNQVYKKMQEKPFAFFKIATMARSSIDLMRTLKFLQEHNTNKNLIAIAMGEIGQSSRVLGKIWGAPWTYACIEDPLENTGQIDLKTLIEIYRYDQINSHTKVYALLGDPVEQSIGHIWHNTAFQKKDLNAVYVKLRVKKDELQTFFPLAKELNFQGFSVTMPLKKIVADLFQGSFQVCNTLHRKDKKFIPYNTDGTAVVSLIEKHCTLKEKRILVLGDGGSARAVIEALCQSLAEVYTWSRKGSFIEETTYCSKAEIQHLNYDVLINATSVGMHPNADTSPVAKEEIQSQSIVVDLVYFPRETLLLKWAKEKDCTCINGEQVFESQAALQQSFWLSK